MKLTTTQSRELGLIRALVFGESGVGKTTSLGTLPPDKTIILAAERGLLPLRQHDFTVLQIETWPDLQEAYAALYKPASIKYPKLAEAVGRCRIVALDSITEVAAICARHIVEVDRPKLVEDRTGGKGRAPEKTYEDQLTMEDWGLYRSRLTNLVAAYTKLPYHVVITGLSAWTEDKITGAQYRGPAISGKFAQEIGAHFDEVFYMKSMESEPGKNVRVWQTFNDGRVVAKDASGVLGPLEIPNWSSVFAKILKSPNVDGKAAQQ